MVWSRENLVWFAGYFEGEGCLHFVGSNRWTLTIASTDEDVLLKASKIIGLGRIYGPYRHPNRPTHKPIWQWRLVGADKVYAVCMAIFPFLGKRRGEHILKFVEKFRLLKKNLRKRDEFGRFLKGGICGLGD